MLLRVMNLSYSLGLQNMTGVKTPASNKLAQSRHDYAWTRTLTCNPEFVRDALSSAGTTDSIFNFFIFLSPAFISLHQNGNRPEPEDETGVPPKSQSTLDSSTTCDSFFSPDVSKCLIFSHSGAEYLCNGGTATLQPNTIRYSIYISLFSGELAFPCMRWRPDLPPSYELSNAGST
jgi:hypothetical protein